MAAEGKIKNETKELEKKLKLQKKLAWDRLKEKDREEVFRFAEGYKNFLDRAKTEREAVREILEAARKAGFREISRPGGGKNFFSVNKEKSIALA